MDPDCDIAIVGYGPVGQTLAILLGRMGHSVAVFERWPGLYPRPRAVHYDDEIARVFQRLGLGEQLAPMTEPATTYEWQNARGQTLLFIDRSEPGPSGWPGATMFNQPQLEHLLDETAKAAPGVEVHQGWEVSDVSDDGGHATLSLRCGEVAGGDWRPTGAEHTVTARFAIGCDGANSLVREQMATQVQDLGFAFDWLIADTIPRDPCLLAGVNLQRCDPARPTTLVSGGPGRRRWEWMLLEGETPEQMERPEVVWELLARSGVGEDDVALERHAVYEFGARWAERWRDGRLLLAGDAAHLMPPFAGQGMCSGIRDALALAWRLDLVLRGAADESILDSYTSERCGHLRHAIELSVALGKVICIADEAEAAARDEVLLAAAADPEAQPIEPPAPVLGPGLHDCPAVDDRPTGAGSLFPQARVAAGGGGRGPLLEDTLGGGFALYALGASGPGALLDEETAAALRALGAALVGIDDRVDPDGVYRAWFHAHACSVALVRPDFYVFGTAAAAAGTRALVRRLSAALTTSATHQETLET